MKKILKIAIALMCVMMLGTVMAGCGCSKEIETVKSDWIKITPNINADTTKKIVEKNGLFVQQDKNAEIYYLTDGSESNMLYVMIYEQEPKEALDTFKNGAKAILSDMEYYKKSGEDTSGKLLSYELQDDKGYIDVEYDTERAITLLNGEYIVMVDGTGTYKDKAKDVVNDYINGL